MSDSKDPGELDARLRTALDADAATVERVVRAALAADAGPDRLRRPGWLPAAAVLATGLILALWLARSPDRPSAPPADGSSIQISNQGEVLAVRHPDGRIWLRRDAVGAVPPTGPRLIILKGEANG